MEIHLLAKQPGSTRAVAKQAGYSRNTVRKMLREAKPPAAAASAAHECCADGFKEYLARRYAEHGLSAVRLLGEIRSQGFTGSIHMVRRFIGTLRPVRRAAARSSRSPWCRIVQP